MKKITVVSAVVAVIVFIVSFLYAGSAKASEFTDPTLDPVRIIQQQKILLVDSTLEETRTFRYAAGAVGTGLGAVAGYSAATAAGVSAAPVVVSGAIIYGAAFYGASTLGVEVGYQMVADEIREKRDAAIEKGKGLAKDLQQEGKGLLDQGKGLLDQGVEKFKSWL
jgi:hypothetical protein